MAWVWLLEAQHWQVVAALALAAAQASGVPQNQASESFWFGYQEWGVHVNPKCCIQ
jgi:hypothetical protein